MNKQTQDAIGWGFAAAIAIPISALAALYALSFSWLSFGILGLLFAGVALALTIAGPYATYAAYQCSKGNEDYRL